MKRKFILSITIFVAMLFIYGLLYQSTAVPLPYYEVQNEIRNGEIQLTYELFGAVGDGQTNDAEAIRRAHEFANNELRSNNNLLTVYGTPGMIYYIGELDAPIVIQTNVNWRGATFIIDDFIDDGNGENSVNTLQNVFIVDSIFNFQGWGFNIGIPQTKPGIEPIEINTNTTNLYNLIEYLRVLTQADLEAGGGVRLG
ncbi:MAG: hypothetical protein FWC79_02030 [Oscillospiraceae bacterium]|nr:hypothetical protein [Oscillospiraceae bacterium]